MYMKLGTKHSWVTGIQVCSNEGHRPFPKGDNCEIAKIHRRNLKIFFSRTIGPISTKLGILGCRGFKFVQIKNHSILMKWDNGVLIMIIICVYWLNCFLRWAIWPIGLLFICILYVFCYFALKIYLPLEKSMACYLNIPDCC